MEESGYGIARWDLDTLLSILRRASVSMGIEGLYREMNGNVGVGVDA